MHFSHRVVTAAALLASGVSGFGVNPVLNKPSVRRTSKVVLFGIRCENKYYQLEEMEDKDNCTTELFLLEDGGVEFGETDGPLWTAAVGQWQVIPGTDNFKMDIVRKFSTGTKGRDMGEFDYEIVRSFVGEMTEVGDSVGIAGVMHTNQSLDGDDKEVGFFSMIDGTDERAERREDARVGVKKDIPDQAATPTTPGLPQYGQEAPPTPAPAAQEWPQYGQTTPEPQPTQTAQDWPQYGQAAPEQQPTETDQGWPQYGQESYPQQPTQSDQGWPQYEQTTPEQQPTQTDQGWPQYGQEAYPQQPTQTDQGWPQYGQGATEQQPTQTDQGWPQYGQETYPQQPTQTSPEWPQYGQESPPLQPNPEWPQQGQAPPPPAPAPSTPDWPRYPV